MTLEQVLAQNGTTLESIQGHYYSAMSPEELESITRPIGHWAGSTAYEIESDHGKLYLLECRDGSTHVLTSEDMSPEFRTPGDCSPADDLAIILEAEAPLDVFAYVTKETCLVHKAVLPDEYVGRNQEIPVSEHGDYRAWRLNREETIREEADGRTHYDQRCARAVLDLMEYAPLSQYLKAWRGNVTTEDRSAGVADA